MTWDSKRLLEAAELYLKGAELKLGSINLDVNGYAICEFSYLNGDGVTLLIKPKKNKYFYKVEYEF